VHVRSKISSLVMWLALLLLKLLLRPTIRIELALQRDWSIIRGLLVGRVSSFSATCWSFQWRRSQYSLDRGSLVAVVGGNICFKRSRVDFQPLPFTLWNTKRKLKLTTVRVSSPHERNDFTKVPSFTLKTKNRNVLADNAVSTHRPSEIRKGEDV